MKSLVIAGKYGSKLHCSKRHTRNTTCGKGVTVIIQHSCTPESLSKFVDAGWELCNHCFRELLPEGSSSPSEDVPAVV